MLSRIMRSPFISTTLFLATLGDIYLLMKVIEAGEPYRLSTMQQIYNYCLIALLVLWATLVSIHNRKNPKDRISPWGIVPSELREVDEGQQWITFKACRNVYIYYSYSLPLAALAAILFIPSSYFSAVIIFGLLGLGQYLVYSLTNWKYSRV
ncbi:hypothetical protein H8B09_25040 [Paenibacillus sp. PR3]|uniref:Uncharacterized protein n=1 Tax=Paenibacillus terricola TaxID=2763503 RepID=A0ABR8N1L0_9BACL|nr:hypothetical protein [Paenibacillus terricola]MBD3922052.1 hypothetical protein [Paenibacillus terricola]